MRVEHETAYAFTGNHHVILSVSDLPKLLREPIKIGHIFIYLAGASIEGGGAGEAIAPPPSFRKLLTPLLNICEMNDKPTKFGPILCNQFPF